MDPRNSTASPVSGDELAGRSVEPGVPAGRMKRSGRRKISVAGLIRNGSREAADQGRAGATWRAGAAFGFGVSMGTDRGIVIDMRDRDHTRGPCGMVMIGMFRMRVRRCGLDASRDAIRDGM